MTRLLNSWKQIAEYLGLGVRTVQRYEVQLGLPVRRPAQKDHSSVIALPEEIDAWLLAAQVKRRLSLNRNQEACPEFLNVLRKHVSECPKCARLHEKNAEIDNAKAQLNAGCVGR